MEQNKASRLLAAGPGSPVPDRAATIVREAEEKRLPPTPAFWPITKGLAFLNGSPDDLELTRDNRFSCRAAGGERTESPGA